MSKKEIRLSVLELEKLGITIAFPQYPDTKAEENTRRLASCWNACAGIGTENLEGNLPFNRQRDQLLGLLECTVHLARQAGFGIKPPLADVLLVFAERVIDKIKDEIKGGAHSAPKVEDQREMLANAIEEMRNMVKGGDA